MYSIRQNILKLGMLLAAVGGLYLRNFLHLNTPISTSLIYYLSDSSVLVDDAINYYSN